MGLFDFLKRLLHRVEYDEFGEPIRARSGLPVAELARRLGMEEAALRQVTPAYSEFTIAKRSGAPRRILAPSPELKAVQRRILRRLLPGLISHPAAHGFERWHSIVSNALPHVGQPAILCMDIRNFFEATSAKRINNYFYRLGWDKDASNLLERLCTYDGSLPPGAPTSPRLSNLVNYRLDARLTALASQNLPKALRYRNPRTGSEIVVPVPLQGIANYTRYADDLTFSFWLDDDRLIHHVLWFARYIVADEGYELHFRKKLRIRRSHDQQRVTGLVVNRSLNLPQTTRRWLRACAHHLKTRRPCTLSPAQLAGWRALQAMIAKGREM